MENNTTIMDPNPKSVSFTKQEIQYLFGTCISLIQDPIYIGRLLCTHVDSNTGKSVVIKNENMKDTYICPICGSVTKYPFRTVNQIKGIVNLIVGNTNNSKNPWVNDPDMIALICNIAAMDNELVVRRNWDIGLKTVDPDSGCDIIVPYPIPAEPKMTTEEKIKLSIFHLYLRVLSVYWRCKNKLKMLIKFNKNKIQ